MTLFRQFSLIVVAALTIVLAGTLVINIGNTRAYLQEQLSSHAQDAATSLGLSLSPHLQQDDIPLVESMVDAIFDRGYYQTIIVASAAGAPLVERRLRLEVEGVPQWFVDLLPLAAPERSSEVMLGWQQGASVIVRSHPGYAYEELWSNTTGTFGWVLLTVIFAAGLTLLVSRSVLRPLQAVEAQALAISNRDFAIVDELPGTRELRRVVAAMNGMSQKIRQILREQFDLAEQMRQEAYTDPVTGLANRRSFERRLHQVFANREGTAPGGLVLVTVNGIDAINRKRGYAAGDDALRQVGQLLLATADTDPKSASPSVKDDERWPARLDGAEFAVLFPGASETELENYAVAIANDLQALSLDDCELIGGHVGAATYAGNETASEVLANADTALRAAETASAAGWRLLSRPGPTSPMSARGAQAWRALLAEVAAKRQLALHTQPVHCLDGDELHHVEVLARIPGRDQDDPEWIPAAVFWPVAARLGYGTVLDQMVIEQVVRELEAQGNKVSLPRYAVNVSAASLKDPNFVAWLVNYLQRAPTAASRIIIEVAEYGALGALEQIRELAPRLKALGTGLAFDHFGAAARSFGYLQSLPLEYIKLDGGFVSALPASPDERFFIGAMVEVAHGLDIPVIAEYVETEQEIQVLRQLHLDGAQGYLIGPPAPMPLTGSSTG